MYFLTNKGEEVSGYGPDVQYSELMVLLFTGLTTIYFIPSPLSSTIFVFLVLFISAIIKPLKRTMVQRVWDTCNAIWSDHH